MPTSTLVQILAACAGVVGSIFFAIGVMRQTVDAMADLSGTYWDANPYMIPALAAQRADYLFGGGIIVLAFALQLSSFLLPATAVIPFSRPAVVPWVAAALTVVIFFVLRYLSRILARRFEGQIKVRLKEKHEDAERKLEERKKAKQSAASPRGA